MQKITKDRRRREEERGGGPSSTKESVVVVGNGASLLGRGLGTFIDNHDIVVRFNLFKTGGYSSDVGTKTDVWFNNRDAHSPQVRSMLRCHSFARIYIHTWSGTAEAVRSFEEALAHLGKSTPVIEVEKSAIKEMKAYLGEPYSFFSTGAIGVWTSLLTYQKVTLVGFDWWMPGERFHYCDDQKFDYSPQSGHQPQVEKRMFDRLAKEGRLVVLA